MALSLFGLSFGSLFFVVVEIVVKRCATEHTHFGTKLTPPSKPLFFVYLVLTVGLLVEPTENRSCRRKLVLSSGCALGAVSCPDKVIQVVVAGTRTD
jgi:hypothetical protein